MNILIVTTGTKAQEEFWQNHLVLPSAKLVVTHEDWHGGAGNGLGTLYAYQKGREKAKQIYGIDILEQQKHGSSVLICHTAGKGMRLAPLALSEHNNKSVVLLPGKDVTILSAVLQQILQLTPQLSGRLAAFWGDQIFVPSNPIFLSSNSHVEILMQKRPFPTHRDWQIDSLDQYGLIGCDAEGQAKILDKCTYALFQKWIQQEKINADGGMGISLGCFHLSYEMTAALLNLFHSELENKTVKMDSDPFMWMPAVLDKEIYIEIMAKKECSPAESAKHYDRMQKFKEIFCKRYQERQFFGAADIGKNSFWWDYGTVSNYYRNNMKLTRADAEGEAMRHIFKLSRNENGSCLIDCKIRSGNIKNSVLVGVEADHLEVDQCLIMNSKVKNLSAQEALLYNVHEENSLVLEKRTVRADVITDGRSFKMYTTLERDGKADWEICLPGNKISYQKLCEKIPF